MAAPLDPLLDVEIRAITAVHFALSQIDRNAQRRVLDWAVDRFLKTQPDSTTYGGSRA